MHTAPAEPASRPEQDEEDGYLDEPIALDTLPEAADIEGDGPEGVELEPEIIDLDADGPDAGEPLELDIGELLEAAAEQEAALPDDVPFEIDPALGLSFPESFEAGDEPDPEPAEDPSLLDEANLPGLGVDDPDDGVLEQDPNLGVIDDEHPIARAEPGWSQHEPLTPVEACSALSVSGAQVVAGSSDLLWFQPGDGSHLRLAALGTRVASLVLLGASAELAIAATGGGQLLRRGRYASQAEALTRFREVAGLSPQARVGLRLSHPEELSPDAFWLVTDGGVLLQSDDAGERFSRIELGGKVLALAQAGACALVASGRERWLALRSTGVFERLALRGAALSVALERSVALGRAGPVIALCAPERSLVVSRDGGASFESVPGTRGATALALGSAGGEVRVWASLYREAVDASDLVEVRASGAGPLLPLGIARLQAPDAEDVDPNDRVEWARVAALSWQREAGVLWAAGGFGVRRFLPPGAP